MSKQLNCCFSTNSSSPFTGKNPQQLTMQKPTFADPIIPFTKNKSTSNTKMFMSQSKDAKYLHSVRLNLGKFSSVAESG